MHATCALTIRRTTRAVDNAQSLLLSSQLSLSPQTHTRFIIDLQPCMKYGEMDNFSC